MNRPTGRLPSHPVALHDGLRLNLHRYCGYDRSNPNRPWLDARIGLDGEHVGLKDGAAAGAATPLGPALLERFGMLVRQVVMANHGLSQHPAEGAVSEISKQSSWLCDTSVKLGHQVAWPVTFDLLQQGLGMPPFQSRVLGGPLQNQRQALPSQVPLADFQRERADQQQGQGNQGPFHECATAL